MLAVPVRGVRLDLGLRELPRQRLDLALVVTELELHRAASIVVPGLASGTAQATLPWSWYSDPEVLRLEQEQIFRRGWHYAGPAELVAEPGGYFACGAGDVPMSSSAAATRSCAPS